MKNDKFWYCLKIFLDKTNKIVAEKFGELNY